MQNSPCPSSLSKNPQTAKKKKFSFFFFYSLNIISGLQDPPPRKVKFFFCCLLLRWRWCVWGPSLCAPQGSTPVLPLVLYTAAFFPSFAAPLDRLTPPSSLLLFFCLYCGKAPERIDLHPPSQWFPPYSHASLLFLSSSYAVAPCVFTPRRRSHQITKTKRRQSRVVLSWLSLPPSCH